MRLAKVIKYLFQGLQKVSGVDVEGSRVTYPEAPVPKSIATMCVYCESSFKKAI